MTPSNPEHKGDPQPQPEREPPHDPPMVWIGSLADYNNGTLHGEWMNPAVEEEELRKQIQAMLARSEQPDAEEWMIFDYDCFGSYRVSEYEDLDSLTIIARGITEHGPAFAAFAEIHGGDPTQLAQFPDAYLGSFDSREDWAQTIVDDFGIEQQVHADLPDWLQSHVKIDLAGIAHDMEIGGDVAIEDNPAGGIWIFDGRI